MGIFHLAGKYQYDLADVRDREPAARGRRACRRDHGDHQRGEGALCVGDARPDALRFNDDACCLLGKHL